jgi:polyisoprenoid-binding protein YceI
MTTWNIDPMHSTIGFSVRHMVVSKVRGRFTKWSASVELDDEDITRSRVSVEIDAGSIDTGVEQRDNHLRSADFFDVETFPSLTFDSRKVERVSDDRLKVTGDLTIHGITKPVVLDVEKSETAQDPWGGTRTGFSAKASIDREAFGLTYNQVLEAGHLLVGKKIEVELEIEAVKDASARVAA